MKKILLVAPDYYSAYPPLGLLKISALEKSKGNEVKYIKGCKQRDMFDSYEPNEIYITSLFTYEYKVVHQTIAFYLKQYPKAKIKVGGIYASLHPEHLSKTFNNKISVHVGILTDAEDVVPDYSLVPEWKSSIVNGSRGCINKCPFCYRKNTPVLTAKGVKNIQDIKKDEEVLVNGNFYRVIDVLKRQYKGKGILFKPDFTNEQIVCTANHRFPTNNGKKSIQNIAQHDKLFLSFPQGKKDELDISKYVNPENFVRTPIKKTILKNEQLKLFMKILGWYIAEGSITKSCSRRESYMTQFCLNPSLKSTAIELKNIIEKMFGIHVGILRDKNLCWQLCIGAKEFALLIKTLCGTNSHSKFLHKDILELKNVYIIELLKYYFNGDGGLIQAAEHKYRISASSVSKSLAFVVFLLLRRLGYKSMIRKEKKSANSVINGRTIKANYCPFCVAIRGKRDVQALAKIFFNKELNLMKNNWGLTLDEKQSRIKEVDNDSAKQIEKRCERHGIQFQTYYLWRYQIKNNIKTRGDISVSRNNAEVSIIKEEVKLNEIVYNLTIEKVGKYNVNGIETFNCVVPKIEGKLKYKKSIKHLIIPEFEKIVMFDNNFFAGSDYKPLSEEIIKSGKEVDMNQGIDCRYINPTICKIIKKMNMPFIRIAYDNTSYRKYVKRAIELLTSVVGVRGREILVYVLYNFNDTPDDFLNRLKDLLNWGTVSFPMRFEPLEPRIKGTYVGKFWTKKQLKLVNRAKGTVMTQGGMPPSTKLKQKILPAKTLEEALSVRKEDENQFKLDL